MKILFSLTYYHPYISGLTLAVSRWAEGLHAVGNDVSVLCMQHENGLKRTERIHGVMVHRASWIAKISKGFVSIDWILQSWRLAHAHDVIVINLPQFEGIITALAAKLQGKRVVSIYHCELALPESRMNTIIQAVVEVSHFCTLWLSDSVITYTRDYARHSRLLTVWRRYTNRDVIPIIPPIPIPKVISRVAAGFKKRIGTHDIVVGIAARLAAEKGFEYLFEALSQLKKTRPKQDIHIVVAGPENAVGEERYTRYIQTLVRKNANSVTFLGSIAPSQMGSFYHCLDVLVLPSVNSTEAFGMVQVEAMLCGVPVIASNLPGVRVPVEKTGMGILVNIRDASGIAAAIQTVTVHKENYAAPQKRVYRIFSETQALSSFITALHSP